MNIIDGNGASEVLRLSALHANKVVKTQVAMRMFLRMLLNQPVWS